MLGLVGSAVRPGQPPARPGQPPQMSMAANRYLCVRRELCLDLELILMRGTLSDSYCL